MENLANPYFEIAISKMKEANQELYRPEEDVVSFVVCKNAQVAVQNFLRGYLLRSGIETKKEDTIDSLYNQCRELNKRFEDVNLSGFNCQYENKDSRYCSGVEKVSRCFDIADSLDSFFRAEKIIS
ncbi:MAG: HEPN domain-containing protein [Muriicola sp.]|nr:HEPN domain-containing protein [Muriicola sp.]MBT8282529.1 HEPN domain-containing protein [Muriicola sp.]NNK11857.1 HEPN domain-containing protein [Flavobacteriaceae bacterium]